MRRKDFIDWVRGVAVIAMVVWHTADGWLTVGERVGQPWAVLRFVGGLAAPSFLLLAGAGLGLAARPDRTREVPWFASLARGLEVMLVGYALRLQTWMIDAAAITKPYLIRGWLPLVLGYALLFLGLRDSTRAPRRARKLALTGIGLAIVGLVQVPWLAPGRLLRLLQVDVLQAIGASLVLLTIGERKLRLLQRPGLAVAIAVAVACVTEPLATLLPGYLPVPIAAYLGKFPSGHGAPAPALFPLFPWFAYACIGAAYGTAMRNAGTRDESFVVRLGLGGALLALLTSEAHHGVQALLNGIPWIVAPMRVAFRTGLVLVMLLGGWVWAEGARGKLLVPYGRSSLRIYWAHLLVAYGVLGAPWQKQLHMGEWAARVALLLILMWLLTLIGTGKPRQLRPLAAPAFAGPPSPDSR